MQARRPRGRRRDALSAAAIVQAAIEILDAEGEEALTFRSLAARLSTGAGAIYHHVRSKEELLAAAAAAVIAASVSLDAPPDRSGEGLRAVLLSAYDAIDAHPWLGAQLSRDPSQRALLHIFESVGRHLEPLSVAQENRFHVATTLTTYLLGAAGQYAAGTRIARKLARNDYLRSVAEDWTSRGSREEQPFVHEVAAQLANHDEREQFGAGLDLILAGIGRPDLTSPT